MSLGDFTSALGGIGGSLLGDFTGGLMSNYFSKDLMKHQNSYNTRSYQHRYQWQVNDMRAAGLNPILSAGAAGSPVSTGIANANASASASTAKQLDNLVQATQGLIKAQRDKIEAESRKATADATSTEIQNMMMFDTGERLSSAKDVKKTTEDTKDSVDVEKNADGTPTVDVNVDAVSPPPLWKVMANARRDLVNLECSEKDINIALKQVKYQYNEQIQAYRNEFAILPALEVFGSSAKQVSGVIKDLKLTPKDLIDMYFGLKKLGLKPEKVMRRKEFNFLNKAFN